MWARRVDLNLAEPMTAGFRYGNGREVFKSRMRCPAEAAEGMQQIAMDGLRWFEEEFARLAALDGREFLGGAAVGLADILMYCCERPTRPFSTCASSVTIVLSLWPDVLWGDNERIGYPLDRAEHPTVAAWYDRMGSRASAAASVRNPFPDCPGRVLA